MTVFRFVLAALGFAGSLGLGSGSAAMAQVAADGSRHSSGHGLGCSVVLDRCVLRSGVIEISRGYAPDATWEIAVVDAAAPDGTLRFGPDSGGAADASPLVFPPAAWAMQGPAGRAVLLDRAKATTLLARLIAQGDRRSNLTVDGPGGSHGGIIDIPALGTDLIWIDRQQGRRDADRNAGSPRAPRLGNDARDAMAQRLAGPGAGFDALPPQVLAVHRRRAPECVRDVPAPGRRGAPPSDVSVNHGLWLNNGDAVFVVFCRRVGNVSTSRLYLAEGEALDRIKPLSAPVWDPQARRFSPKLDLPGDVVSWSGLQQLSHRWTVGGCDLVQTTRVLRGEAVVVAIAGNGCRTLDGRRQANRMGQEQEIFRAPPEHR